MTGGMDTIGTQKNSGHTDINKSASAHGYVDVHSSAGIRGYADVHGYTDIHGYIDIHTHILPGVDDGSASMEQSIRMARQAAMEGFSDIILTPHQKADRRCVTYEGTLRRMRLLQEKVDELKIPVRFHPGAELFYRHGMEALLEEGRLHTLADSHYALVEFFPGEEYAYIRDALVRISSYGYLPILAHVERYLSVTSEAGRAQQLKENTGCFFQVNASSLTGDAGFAIKSAGRKIVRQGLADFVATDSHNDTGRSPRISHCAGWLEKKLGKQEAERLLIQNPRAVLEDRPLR